MSVRVKTKRRLMYLATAGVLVAALGGGAYAFRSRSIAAQLVQSRAEGVEALKSGNYEVALHKIGRYVQRNGNDAEALYQYALAREQVPEANGRHIGQAIAVYRQLLSLDPSRLEARRRLLGLYVDYGFNQEAVDTADAIMSVEAKAQASAEDRRAALRGKARALARQRKFDKALDALTEFGKVAPTDLEMQRLALEVMLARGDPATDAVERAQRLLGEHPDDARFELLLGIAFRMAEARGDGAPGASSPARRWVTAAAAHPLVNDPAFVGILVEQLEGLELFEDSLRVLAQSSGTGAAGAAENHRLYVARLWQAGKYGEVDARLKDLNPADKATDSELLALRAVALRELKRPAEAAPIVEALGRRFDPSAEGWAPILKSLLASDAAGDSAAADAPANRDVLRACSDAVGRAPRNPYFRYFLGNAFSAAGEQELALLHWRHAIELAPAWAAPRLKLAELGLAAALPAEAVDFALAARARAPEDPEVAVALANALAASLARQDAGGDVAARDRVAQQLRDEVARVEKLSPGHEAALVLTTILNAATGHREQAVASARAALDPARTLKDTTYLRLGAISAAYHLGVEDELHTRCEKAVGRLTPALAAYKARVALSLIHI